MYNFALKIMSRVQIKQIPFDLNWHEGMLLSPHQFQQNDLRVQQTVGAHLNYLNQYHYGVCSMEIDTMSLSDGVFRINEVDAIFQDGLILAYHPKKTKNLKPIEVSLADIPDNMYEFFVFLCIAEYSEDVSPILGNPARYYSIEGDVVSDFNVKDLTVKIPRLYPNAFLHAGVGLPEFCMGFPIAKLSKSDNLFKIKDWSHTCLALDQGSRIMKECSAIAASIREKATFLSDKLRSQIGGVGSYDIERLLMRLLNVLPVIENAVCSKFIKPYELYSVLLVALGIVSTLIPSEVPPVLSPYNHTNIDLCFNQVMSLIRYYIATIERGFEIKQFSRDEKFFYVNVTREDLKKFTDRKIYIGVRGSNSVDSIKIEKWITESIIVSDFAIEEVGNKRIKGAGRNKAEQHVVTKITPGIGVLVFEIDIDESFIKGDQHLHIFNHGVRKEDMPSELMIYIPRNVNG